MRHSISSTFLPRSTFCSCAPLRMAMVTTGQPRLLYSLPNANHEIAKLFTEIFAQYKVQLRLIDQIKLHRNTQNGGQQMGNSLSLCKPKTQIYDCDKVPQGYDELLRVDLPYALNHYLLSRITARLPLEVPQRQITHEGNTYNNAFTGKEFINFISSYYLRRYLPLRNPQTDRNLATALTRSLQYEQFLVRLDQHVGNPVDEAKQDSSDCILSFSTQQSERNLEPFVGVFTPMLPCYSPACDGISPRTCYSATCPRKKVEGKLRVLNYEKTCGRLEDGIRPLYRLIKEEEDYIFHLSMVETHVIEIFRTAKPSFLGIPGDASNLISEIFHNISDVKAANQWLLNSLYTRMQQHPYEVEIGDIFITAFERFVFSYPMYLENLPRALNRLKEERMNNSDFRRIVRECERLPVLGESPLSEFLLLPLGHLQSYPRKLEDFLIANDMETGNADALLLSEAIDSVNSILSISRLMNLESEMACNDRRPKRLALPRATMDPKFAELSGPTENRSKLILNDDWNDIDISKHLVEFEEQIDASLMGGFGIIRKGLLVDGTAVAIKTLKLHHVGLANIAESKRFQRELRIWRRLKHNNVLPFLGVLAVFRARVPMSLVSPWIKNGNSLEFCVKRPDVLRIPIITMVAEGIAYLHSESVIHGDIKAANILISNDGVPLICDFGLAYVCDSTEEQSDQTVSTTIRKAGSLRHMAIELHESESPGLSVSRESDMWAFGMFCVELLTLQPPFHGQSEGMVVVNIMAGRMPGRPYSVECQDYHWKFIRSCWRNEPKMRPDAHTATIELQGLRRFDFE